jgi:hypothetical protein
MVLLLAVAVKVPVVSKGPEIFNVELAAFTQVEPVTVPVIPPVAVVVIVPLFVIRRLPLIAIVPAIVRLADESMVLLPPLTVKVPVFVIEPVPSRVLFVPENAIAPVPLIVPSTSRLPETVSVRLEMFNVEPEVTVNVPLDVVLPARVAMAPDLLIIKFEYVLPVTFCGLLP